MDGGRSVPSLLLTDTVPVQSLVIYLGLKRERLSVLPASCFPYDGNDRPPLLVGGSVVLSGTPITISTRSRRNILDHNKGAKTPGTQKRRRL
jgi:hypothetical protein